MFFRRDLTTVMVNGWVMGEEDSRVCRWSMRYSIAGFEMSLLVILGYVRYLREEDEN